MKFHDFVRYFTVCSELQVFFRGNFVVWFFLVLGTSFVILPFGVWQFFVFGNFMVWLFLCLVLGFVCHILFRAGYSYMYIL